MLEFICLMLLVALNIIYSQFAVFGLHSVIDQLLWLSTNALEVGVGHFISVKALLLGVGEVVCALNLLPFLCHNHNSQVLYSWLPWGKQRTWQGSEAYAG